MAATPRKLSSKEVAALVGNLMEASDSLSMENGLEVRPYAFGENDLNLLGDYHALRMINERFCRTARDVFLPMLRLQPRISSFPPEVRSFDDYRSSQDNFVSITASRIEELRGNQMIVIPPPFISLLTDSYYGGQIRHIKSARTEFTATEQRVIELVTDRLNIALQLAWRDLMALTFAVASREESMQFASFVDGDDMIVNCSFMVQLPGTEPASFDVLYPLQTLKPISSQLRSRMQSDFVDDDRTWREKLQRAILEVPLTLSARLCEPEVPLRQLMQIQPGDVLPVQLSDTVSLLVEGQPIFDATPGERGGQTALNLTRRRTRS
ncbi:flagellar motor switch protein FliM [Cereibacter sphaeroides]|uniref:flagellar motor switch protein FliM n=1 Tax=Rhodobacterales TaxID=204455 RepID=UPI000BBE3015|nr:MULTISPECIES: flagellar motor switch protein FliM [Paracoccaceae]MCE6952990.1 flagellar motor switch protein FliM [Cereibacter sphaeroides]MCE6961912.1 flagellar motor switch protein FliM [Cereibacter sphaeroides]MCE6975717.1 flagellar motor switch protein FliM [Cereibacter sphaeroides]